MVSVCQDRLAYHFSAVLATTPGRLALQCILLGLLVLLYLHGPI